MASFRRPEAFSGAYGVASGDHGASHLGIPVAEIPSAADRDNIVITHDTQYRAVGATVVGSLEDALDLARQEAIPDDGLDRSEIWVIGGAELFREAMPIANKVYVTDIDAEVDADTYAPDIDALAERGEWSVTDRSARLTPKNADSGIEGYRFRTFERVR